MNRGIGWRMALWLAWPVLLLVADFGLRWRIIARFSWSEWSYYVASVVVTWVAFGVVLWALRWLRERPGRWGYGLGLALVGALQLAILGVSYGVFVSNGDLPDLFLLSDIRCEPNNAIQLARDSFRWHYLIVMPLLVVALAWDGEQGPVLCSAGPTAGDFGDVWLQRGQGHQSVAD